ncbi:hypothetical protein SAMN04488074_108243 [Lentzea albidocapillata subsp. violacea]|uniref:Uncharacterized protein n=1 Tax=Lentzea albidocapillata subsp. violacea TaxID=128104 RepID=A0A1G9GKK3_9PSEU|nr:hypothetical protein [Lentzea albidocapillata]SDL01220.1 hypothetical protein SAMN04488074_108243 [Lentzea albidocapillata subsp. violacea]
MTRLPAGEHPNEKSGHTAEASAGIGTDGLTFGVVVPAALADSLTAAAITFGILGLVALALGWYIVRKTGKTEGLLHLAELVKALFRRK